MLTYLSGEEKLETRELWEQIFDEDSASFLDYYYSEKIRDNRILAIREDGAIQSMVQMNPYVICARGRRWRVDYIVGVATREEKRHHGYMRQLLLAMMADMRAEEAPFCFLMPADEAIYRPFGFTWIFRQPQWKRKEGNGICSVPFTGMGKPGTWAGHARYTAEMAEWMNRWLAARYQLYAVRDEAYLRRLLKEIASENGQVELLYRADTMIGMQSEWGWNRREQRFLYCDSSYVEEAAEPKPAIMARVITPEVFVRVIRLKSTVLEQERQIRLALEDPLIPENEGLWNWHLNRQTSWLEPVNETERIRELAACEEDLRLTVTELTEWLFGYAVPKAAEPFADVVEPLNGVFLDEVV